MVAGKEIMLPIEPISAPALQRSRRQYVVMNRVHMGSMESIQDDFIEYIKTQI